MIIVVSYGFVWFRVCVGVPFDDAEEEENKKQRCVCVWVVVCVVSCVWVCVGVRFE